MNFIITRDRLGYDIWRKEAVLTWNEMHRVFQCITDGNDNSIIPTESTCDIIGLDLEEGEMAIVEGSFTATCKVHKMGLCINYDTSESEGDE